VKALRRGWRRLAGSMTGGKRENELADELQSHLEMLMDDNIRGGMTPTEARRAALLQFGGLDVAKENCRDQRGLPSLDSFCQDIRYALRGMKRNPLFTAIAVACLALGIGANTAVFSLVNAVMLRALPVSHPEQLAFFSYSDPGGDMRAVRRTITGFSKAAFPYATYEMLRDHARTLTGVFVYTSAGIESNGMTVDAAGRPFTADGEMVTGSYFPVLGVSPVLGRAILDSDLNPNAPSAVVISYKLWAREFGGQSSAIGRSIRVNTESFTIVGVAPPGFAGLSSPVPDLWFPLRPSPAVRPWASRAKADAYYSDSRWWWCTLGGRMRPGATLLQVQAEAEYLYRRSITAEASNAPARLPVLIASNASPAFQSIRKAFATPLYILLASAILMLLMACANLAALLLARAKARQKEISIRLAIGAARARVIRQLLTESVVLSAAGGALGLLLACWGAPALLRLIVGSRLTTPLNVSPDGAVLAFTATASVATGILFGLTPAVWAAREDLAPQLKQATASATSRGTVGRALVMAQTGLSVVLLFGAGLFHGTLRNLSGQNLGFDQDNLLLFDVDHVRSGYTGASGMALHNQIAARISRLPGVVSATYVQEALLSGFHNTTLTATDAAPNLMSTQPDDYYNRVGPGFFNTMRMRILLGRDIELRDTNGEHPAAVVNRAWVRAHFPKENPVGHRISSGGGLVDPRQAYEIVGVAEDAKYNSMRDAPPRTVYIAYGAKWDRARRMCFAVRVAGSPGALVAQVTDAVHAVAPGLPLYNVRTQHQQIEEAMGVERILARVSSFCGALALLLVGIGVYGTLSYTVARRTGEIGIRMALGARRTAVVWMIQRESLAVTGIGLAAGLPTAFVLSRFAESALFGIASHDSVTIGATVGMLVAITAISGFLPANRAARIDPIRALHHE
jgi:predicted permease